MRVMDTRRAVAWPRAAAHIAFAALAVLAGCQTDLALPSGARLTCAGAGDCPEGWVCADRVGRCVLAEAGDREPPSVLADSIDLGPPLASLDATIEVSFSVNEPLGADPLVSLDVPGGSPFALVESAEATYRVAYTPAGDEPVTPTAVLASLVDRSGNAAEGLLLGTVRFDFVRPDVDVVLVSSALLAAGKRLIVEVTASEALEAPPVLRLDEDGPELALDGDDSGLAYRYQHTVAVADGAGVHGISVEAADEAGNGLARVETGLVTFDFEPPAVDGEPSLTRPVAAPGDAIGLSCWVSEPLAGPPSLVLVSGERELPFASVDLAGLLVSGTHVVQAGEDGVWDVRLELEDVAGNEATHALEPRFVLDGVAPEVRDGRLTTDPEVLDAAGQPVLVVGDDNTLRARFSVRDERELAPEPPTVVLEALGLPLPLASDVWQRGDDGTWAAEHSLTLDADLHEAARGVAWPVRVSVADAAGNLGVASPLGGERVRVDFSPPRAQCVSSRSLAKAGDTIQVDVHLDEPVRPESVAAACGERTGGGDVPCERDPWLPAEQPEAQHFVFRHTLLPAGGSPWWYRVRARDLVGYEGDGGWVCEGEVPVDREPIVVGRTGPDVAPVEASLDGADGRIVTGLFATRGSDVAIRFSLDDQPAPGSLRLRVGEDELDPAAPAEGTLDYVYAYRVPDDAPAAHEDVAPVTVEVSDPAGNVTNHTLGTLQRDFTPPEVAGVYLGLPCDSPDAPCDDERRRSLARARLAPDEVVARAGVEVAVQFTVSEPTLASDGLPVPLRLLANGELLSSLDHEARQTRFEALVVHPEDGGRPEWTARLEVDVSDRAGNSARLPLGTVHFDAARPDALSEVAQASLVHYRAPTGAAETDGLPVSELRACPAPGVEAPWSWCPGPESPRAFEPAALVTVFSTRGVEQDGERRLGCGDVVLAEEVTDPASGLLALPVPGDWPGVCVRQTDRAGNASEIRLVRTGEWLASLSGKRRGSTLENPHRLQRVYSFAPETLRQYGQEVEAAQEDLDAAALPDGQSGESNLHRAWDYFPTYEEQPAGMAGMPFVYSPETGSSVFLDGPETWEWRGNHWRTMSLDTSPSYHYLAASAYDGARGRIVTFGGLSVGQSTFRQDTWEFDGERWIERVPAGDVPWARYGHAGAYDPSRGRFVVHGGYGGERYDDRHHLDDLWEWDGTRWERIEPLGGVAPPPLFAHQMVWHAGRQRLVVYGGCLASLEHPDLPDRVCTDYSDDLWEWDGEAWALLQVEGETPPSRCYHTLVWDSTEERLLVFGGFLLESIIPTRWTMRGDLWAFAGERWEEVAADGDGPLGRANPSAVFDAVRGMLVVVGGVCSDRPCEDTWLWDAGGWRQPTGAGPAARAMHSLVFDGSGSRAVMFGGIDVDGEPLDELWEWRAPVWTRLPDDPEGPPARGGHIAVWGRHAGEGSERMFVFGGCAEVGEVDGDDDGCTQALADAWTWDGSTWEQVHDGGGDPKPRWRHAAAHDALTGRTLVFGGLVDSDEDGVADRVRRDVYEWDGNTWTRRHTEPRPHYLFDAAMAPSPTLGELVLFGGVTRDGQWSAETWTWDGAAWTEHEPDGYWPQASGGHLLVADAGRARTIVGWGYASDETFNRFFDWRGSGWKRSTSDVELVPTLRTHAGAAYDAPRRRLVTFGGRVFGYSAVDTWEWDLDPEQRPATRFDVNFGFEGADMAELEAVAVRAVVGGMGATLDVDADDEDGDLYADPVLGAELLGWDAPAARWVALGDNDAGWDAPGEIAWASPDPDAAWALLRRRALELHFVLTPKAGEGNGGGRPRVATDYAEARVRYRWP